MRAAFLWASQLALGLLVALGLIYSSSLTEGLVKAERQLTANALRQPQLADPLQTFVEVTLPEGPLPLLSGGYLGISPSIHLVRLNTVRPLANVDQIENLARRRHGRVELGFLVTRVAPLFLLPIAILVTGSIRSRASFAAVREGRKKLFDFAAENVLLPLSAWGAFSLAALLASLFAFGLRLESNDQLLRLGVWLVAVGAYALFWLLLYLWLLVRLKKLSDVAAAYAGLCLLFTLLLPAAAQSLVETIAAPTARTHLGLMRKELSTLGTAVDNTAVERLYEKYKAQRPAEALSPQALATLTALAKEQEMAPALGEFEARLARHEAASAWFTYSSPATVLADLGDELAGTGLGRYASFRREVECFADRWREYVVPFLLERRTLDFDDLKAAPKFAYTEENGPQWWLRAASSLIYLGALCAALAWAIRREWQSAS
ncbi:MAG: DUF3526 domain-containing protein [Bryobacter sp.]|nr:DUF3526 domain-containing protein [Bryobacter sp.]